MMKIRRSHDRGHARHGWLESFHSFSFAGYYDPRHMGFRRLRVINQDLIAPSSGFPTHPHRDMEIISYLVEGQLAHRDSMGHTEVITRGEVQYMSAGTGVAHSEYNPSLDERAHLLQIWIEPQQLGLKPRYAQRSFLKEFEGGGLVQVLSPDGAAGSLEIHQDARLHIAWPKEKSSIMLPLKKDRHGWLQVVRGEIAIGDQVLGPGDAAAISGEENPVLEASAQSEFLFFDLA